MSAGDDESGGRGGDRPVPVEAMMEPEILSSIALPINPPSSGNAGSRNALKYKHILAKQAINPRMDLVAIVSRDVNVATTGTAPAAADPYAGLPPPPPGMSAARSQALMRMRMQQRAKALAAAGITVAPPSEGAAGSAAANGPKVSHCATIRLSLWRMASVAGEQGSRVWDVAVNVPDQFEDAGKDVRETQDISVDGQCWSPDGLLLALAVTVARRTVGQDNKVLRKRFVTLYALQDGKQVRLTPIGAESSQSNIVDGMEWRTLANAPYNVLPGSAEHILSLLKPLPDIKSIRDDQEGKARQRQRIFQAMRAQTRTKPEEDKKAEEIMASEPRGLGKPLVQYPRDLPSVSLGKTLKAREFEVASILYCWSDAYVHLLLGGSIYLGSLRTALPHPACSARLSTQDGIIRLMAVPSTSSEAQIHFEKLRSCLLPSREIYKALLHVRTLSTLSYDLSIYCFDAIVSMRTLYRTMHADCIAPWHRRARRTAKNHVTHLHSEALMLLCTGVANDAMEDALLSSEGGLSENDLKKMRTDALSAFKTLEQSSEHLTSALQRLIVVYEEVRGCCNWDSRCGLFFGTNGTDLLADSSRKIDAILRSLASMARQTRKLARICSQENHAWTHFYRWWTLARTRVELLKGKATPDALAALGMDASFDAILLIEFIPRGFDNSEIENILGITMDAKTRGTEAEDDDEEEEEGERSQQKVPHDHKLGETSDESTPGAVLRTLVSEEGSTEPWYSNRILDQSLSKAKEALTEAPKVEKLFSMIGKLPPSPADMERFYTGQVGLYAGPAAGLDERTIEQPVAVSTVSLKSTISDVIAIASPLFAGAFARWGEYVQSTEEKTGDDASDSIEIGAGEVVMRDRRDRLVSLVGPAPTPSPDEKEPLLRTFAIDRQGVHRIAAVLKDDTQDVQSTLVIVHRGQHDTLFARLSFGDEEILDMSFFSIDEIIVLLCKQDAVRLVSIRLNELTFTTAATEAVSAQPHTNRSVLLNSARCGQANALAINRHKDVCATLDDEGHLVYWDMVMPSGAVLKETVHDATLTDADEEMPYG